MPRKKKSARTKASEVAKRRRNESPEERAVRLNKNRERMAAYRLRKRINSTTARLDEIEEDTTCNFEDPQNDVERSEVGELVTVGAAGRLMQSIVDASLGAAPTPTALIKMGHHMRLLHGRYFFLKSSQLTTQYLDSREYAEIMGDTELRNAVRNYHLNVNAHLIKKSLQMHPFYSTYSAALLKRKRKNNEVLTSLGTVFDTADKLSESVKKQKELYNEYLERNLQHPAFYNRCIQELDDHRSTLQQQNIDKEAKEKVAKKKLEVKLMAELSSRLLVVTDINNDALLEVLIDVADVLNQVL